MCTHQRFTVGPQHTRRGDRGTEYADDPRGVEAHLLEYAPCLRAQHGVDFDRHQGGKE